MKTRRSYRCFECNLPDPYDGQGDGIGSCDCPRCEYCNWPPGVCNCSDDDLWDFGDRAYERRADR